MMLVVARFPKGSVKGKTTHGAHTGRFEEQYGDLSTAQGLQARLGCVSEAARGWSLAIVLPRLMFFS
jgi:hypothetical protein